MGKLKNLEIKVIEIKRTDKYIRWQADDILLDILREFTLEVLNSKVHPLNRMQKPYHGDKGLRFSQYLFYNQPFLECLTNSTKIKLLEKYLAEHNITFIFNIN